VFPHEDVSLPPKTGRGFEADFKAIKALEADLGQLNV